jgi:hypothetical protein
MLIPILKVVAKYHIIKFHDRREITKPNINVMVEKWIPCDFSWTLSFLKSEYVIRLRGNEKYYPEEIKSKEDLSTMMIMDPYKKMFLN